MSLLDDVETLRALDPGGMLRQVADLPRQLAAAPVAQPVVATAVERALRGHERNRLRQALVCGMGGSAIGGDYAAVWAAAQGVQLHVHRGAELPVWVDEDTFFLFSSYSGDTEETLSAYRASPRQAVRLCITTGGALREQALADGVPVVALPGGLQPRAALGHSMVAVLLALHGAGWLKRSPLPELAAAERRVRALAAELAPEVPQVRNRAKQLAAACASRLTWIWTGNGILEPVGRRWRAQWNENAEALALVSVVPEMCHNEVMAAPNPVAVCRETHVLVLHDAEDSAAVQRRLQLLEELQVPHLQGCDHVESANDVPLARMLSTTYLGDLASVYLSFLHGVDPTRVERIEVLKKRLQDPS